METKVCTKCGVEKPLSEFGLNGKYKKTGKQYHRSMCRYCYNIRYNELKHISNKRLRMQDNKSCGCYLGVWIAERALSKFFDHIERMPYGNPGYDFVCGKGFKIDVKCSCLSQRKDRGYSRWQFEIRHNQAADYFLLLAFDTRENLKAEHVWLIPGHLINHQNGFSISNLKGSISRNKKWERPLDRVISCCSEMRGQHQ